MRVAFSFDDIADQQDLKEKLAGKFSSLDKFLTHLPPELQQASVRVTKGNRWGYRVVATVPLPKREVAAEAEDKELLTAIDQVVNRLSAELRKRWEKLRAKRARL